MLYLEGLYTASVYGTLFESSKLILLGAKSSRELQQYQTMKSFPKTFSLYSINEHLFVNGLHLISFISNDLF